MDFNPQLSELKPSEAAYPAAEDQPLNVAGKSMGFTKLMQIPENRSNQSMTIRAARRKTPSSEV